MKWTLKQGQLKYYAHFLDFNKDYFKIGGQKLPVYFT